MARELAANYGESCAPRKRGAGLYSAKVTVINVCV
jgi:hypothetical protein